MIGARRRAGDRWSASFTVQATCDGAPRRVEADVTVDDSAFGFQLRDATAVRFRWRHDGKSRSCTFVLPTGEGDALAFPRRLAAAIAGR